MAECDRYLQEFGIVTPILLEKTWQTEVTDQDRRIFKVMTAEKVEEISQAIKKVLADGTANRKELATQCNQAKHELSQKSGEILNKTK